MAGHVGKAAKMVMHCGCGRQDCETRIYADDIMVSGVHIIFNHKNRDGEQVGLERAEQLEIPASDAALKQLVKDALFVLRQRADKQLKADIGLEESP